MNKNITKKQPLTIEHFEECFRLLPDRANSERSWSVSTEEIEAKNYDIKAVNPNRKEVEDKRTPDELVSIIELQTREIQEALIGLRNKGI